jgi:hypothetical protein
MMQEVNAKALPVRIGEDFREYYIDGPIRVSDINGLLVITLGNVRPTIDPAGTGKASYEVVARCRLTLPEHVAQQMVLGAANHLAKMKAGSGHA